MTSVCTPAGPKRRPRERQKPFVLNHQERAHSAKCRAMTLRQVAAATRDAGARARLEANATTWEAEAEEALRLAGGEQISDYRRRRLDASPA
ncbi:MAG: hypothetical protein AB7E79_16490 [Rhodospirillaceae bacterium]